MAHCLKEKAMGPASRLRHLHDIQFVIGDSVVMGLNLVLGYLGTLKGCAPNMRVEVSSAFVYVSRGSREKRGVRRGEREGSWWVFISITEVANGRKEPRTRRREIDMRGREDLSFFGLFFSLLFLFSSDGGLDARIPCISQSGI